MEYAPVWRRDASLPEDVTTESIPAETDLAVVGAGYTGLAAALAAAGSDLRITVLDAGSISGGASSVNGGMVNIGLKAPAAWLLKRFGKEAGRAFWDSSIASIDLVERIVQDEGIDCHVARPGAAKLGHAGRDYIVATAPLDGALVERLIPRSRMLWTARRLLNYFRRTPDDRILFGGRNNLSTDLDLRESARILRRSAVDVFPELHDVAFTHAWGGQVGGYVRPDAAHRPDRRYVVCARLRRPRRRHSDLCRD